MRTSTGFSLIELLVTITVLGVLMAVAIPSFQSLVQSNRVSTEANLLVGDVYFARAEAIKQGMPVTICASSNGTSCTTNTSNWKVGWIVYSDSDGDQVVDSGETLLRVQKALSGTDTMVSSNSANSNTISAVTYNRDGFAISLPGSVTWTLNTTPVNAAARKCVVLNIIGHQKMQSC